nr:unnamed protein product [Callosobruchus chinensis]
MYFEKEQEVETHFVKTTRCNDTANIHLAFEVLNTLVVETETILNYRPLSSLCSDANDLLVLTSGNFLIGDSL